jgi:glycine cleavage system H protein
MSDAALKILPGLRYTPEHEWIRKEDGAIGITDFAQHELGDVVFVDLPRVGAAVTAGKPFGSVESVKAVSDLFAPVSGKVLAVNDALAADPARINSDPFGGGWLIKVRPDAPGDVDALMSDADYAAHTGK